MIRKTFGFMLLVAFLLSSCVYPPPQPTATPSFTPTSSSTPTNTDTPTPTNTATQTLTPTWTPTFTLTPIQFQSGIFSGSDAIPYYGDPSLARSIGTWKSEFYICARYLSQKYNSYQIAESSQDCINHEALGWVQSEKVILSAGQFPPAQTTFVPPEAKQCANLIDDDKDEEIDYPADPGCEDANDDREDEAPIVQPVVPPDPDERVLITHPRDGFDLHCPTGDGCPINVTVQWTKRTPGNRICVFVQPLEVPGQQYYFQFKGETGQAWIGVAQKNNTNFKIVAVSTSQPCVTGSRLPRGKSNSVKVRRIND